MYQQIHQAQLNCGHGHFFPPPHKYICPPPWSGIPMSACLGMGGGLAKEEGRERGSGQIHGVGGVSTCPKCLPLLRPWTCGLRTGRAKASPVGRTLLGGHAQCALPPGHPQERRRRRRRHGEWNKYSHPSTTMWVSKPKDTSALTVTKMFN